MDVLYEESVVNANSSKGEKWYKIINVLSIVFGMFALIVLLFFLYFIFGLIAGGKPGANAKEELLQAYAMVQSGAFIFGFLLLLFGGTWLWLRFFIRRVNVSYDYTFVSGELRIAKVFNVNRRKFLFKISSENILQVGDVDCDSYDRIKADPMTKETVCTPNSYPANGKFFLYVHCVDGTGRKLYILECREEMLVQILKFVKRGTLAPDYVQQDKKNK